MKLYKSSKKEKIIPILLTHFCCWKIIYEIIIERKMCEEDALGTN